MGKFYVTTPIFYVNAAPHLGHAYADAAGDVLARYYRSIGRETFFLAGTDEHGMKIARAAAEHGKNPEEFVAENREKFRALLARLGATNDEFINTSDDKRHWPGVKAMLEMLIKNGDLYKKTYSGLYCVGHEAFVTEKDLENGICADHGKKPEIVEEENYFFRLSKYSDAVKNKILSGELAILPPSRKNEVLAFLKGGAEDVSFSRPRKDLSWGVPFPGDGEHTVYVWAEALINYVSALGFGRDDDANFKKFWPADAHIIGKDILRFHAVIWPGILMAAGLPLPKTLVVHGMILSGGKKMSKTLGNVIDPFTVMEKYGLDPFRYFLMREIPFMEDGDFTLERFEDAYNGSLAHGLGNLVERVKVMAKKYFGGKLDKQSDDVLRSVPAKNGETVSECYENNISAEFACAIGKYQLTHAIKAVFEFYAMLDGYVQLYEPFKLVNADPEKARAVLWNLAYHIQKSADLLEPFMPDTSGAIRGIFSLGRDGSITIHDSKPIFPPINKSRQYL